MPLSSRPAAASGRARSRGCGRVSVLIFAGMVPFTQTASCPARPASIGGTASAAPQRSRCYAGKANVTRKGLHFPFLCGTGGEQRADLRVGHRVVDVLRADDQLDQVASGTLSAPGTDEHAEGQPAVWIGGSPVIAHSTGHNLEFYFHSRREHVRVAVEYRCVQKYILAAVVRRNKPVTARLVELQHPACSQLLPPSSCFRVSGPSFQWALVGRVSRIGCRGICCSQAIYGNCVQLTPCRD